MAIIWVFVVISLGGCTIFQQLRADAQEANEYAEEFCFAFSFDDIEIAKEYLHPDWISINGDLENYLEKFENVNGIDFSNGVSIKRRFWEEATGYHSQYDGSIYRFGITVVVGDKTLNMYFVVVDNNKGYGLYDFGLYSERPD
jgi:hypothetical protein